MLLRDELGDIVSSSGNALLLTGKPTSMVPRNIDAGNPIWLRAGEKHNMRRWPWAWQLLTLESRKSENC
jgi:hypothetical protein